MSERWDLAVYDSRHQLALAVQVKNLRGIAPDWAAEYRRNILARGIYPNAPYFLIAFPDRFYLWVNEEPSEEPVPPSYTIDATPIFQPYLDRAGIPALEASGRSLEMILSFWLDALAHGEQSPDLIEGSQDWLNDSGLYRAIKGGSVHYEIAV